MENKSVKSAKEVRKFSSSTEITQQNSEPDMRKVQRAVMNIQTASPDTLLELQRMYGNKAVSKLIQQTKNTNSVQRLAQKPTKQAIERIVVSMHPDEDYINESSDEIASGRWFSQDQIGANVPKIASAADQKHGASVKKDDADFSNVGLNEPIVLVGHGKIFGGTVTKQALKAYGKILKGQTPGATGVAGLNPDEITEYLIKRGLPQNYKGVIYFEACGSGVGNDNDDSVAEQVYKKLLAAGYYFLSTKGTRGFSQTTTKEDAQSGEKTTNTRVISDKSLQWAFMTNIVNPMLYENPIANALRQKNVQKLKTDIENADEQIKDLKIPLTQKLRTIKAAESKLALLQQDVDNNTKTVEEVEKERQKWQAKLSGVVFNKNEQESLDKIKQLETRIEEMKAEIQRLNNFVAEKQEEINVKYSKLEHDVVFSPKVNQDAQARARRTKKYGKAQQDLADTQDKAATSSQEAMPPPVNMPLGSDRQNRKLRMEKYKQAKQNLTDQI